MKNHPLKEKIINLPEEEPGSAFNESIDEEKEERHVGTNHLGGKDEAPNTFSIMGKSHDSLSSSIDQEEEYIRKVGCKSLQGDCMGEESENECTFIFFVGDF